MQQETKWVTLLKNHFLKLVKKGKIFDDETNDYYQNKTKEEHFREKHNRTIIMGFNNNCINGYRNCPKHKEKR